MVVDNIVNFLSQSFTSSRGINKNTSLTTVSNNPFGNPFVNQNAGQFYSYAKNKPVSGGYFAGYYNGKANIVGQRLFLEA